MSKKVPNWHIAQTRPENLHWRTGKLARSLILVVLLEGVAILGLLGLVLSMHHMRTVVPYFVYFHRLGEGLVEVRPLEDERGRWNLVAEGVLRDYVDARHRIIPSETEMRRRWDLDGFVHTHSSPTVYREFTLEASAQLELLQQGLFSRDIEILSAAPRTESPTSWVIDFREYDLPPSGVGTPTAVRDRTAYMETAFVELPPRPTKEELMKNPSGIIIVSYNAIGGARQQSPTLEQGLPPAQ